MKIFKQVGSKERFLEVFQGVNKIKLNEAFGQGLNPQSVLNVAFNDLKSNNLEVSHTNTQADDNQSFVELVCVDKEGNNITFTFRAVVQEGDQEGVYDVTDVSLDSFSFDSIADEESVEMSSDMLKQFNAQHKNEMFEIVDEYIDVDTEEAPSSLYEDATKLIDKIPYKAGSEQMVKHSQYADEKPTNPALRVDAEELKKFVKEDFKTIIPDTSRTITTSIINSFNKLSPDKQSQYINQGQEETDRELGRGRNMIDPRNYEKMVYAAALTAFANDMTHLNEAEDYPEGLGKEFKPESQTDYAKKTKTEKKRKTKKVKIKESYFVVDSEFNREFFNESIGKTFSKPVPYAQVKKLTEQFEYEDDDEIGIEDEIPMNSKAEKFAKRDIKRELPKDDIADPFDVASLSEDLNGLFAYSQAARDSGILFPQAKAIGVTNQYILRDTLKDAGIDLLDIQPSEKPQKFWLIFSVGGKKYRGLISQNYGNAAKVLKGIKMRLEKGAMPMREEEKPELNVSVPQGEVDGKNDGMSFEPAGDEIEQISQEKEKAGDLLQGGKADGKLPSEYDPEQIKMGLDVEKEHSDNPLVAVEIATDHLEELPDYYTRLDAMEKEAGEGEEGVPRHELGAYIEDGMPGERDRNGHPIPAIDPDFSKMGLAPDSDKETTDELLGYKPMNVGETLDYGDDSGDAHQKYLEYGKKDFNTLSDEEKEEFFELWKQFKNSENVSEEIGYDEYQGQIGDKYADAEGNQFSVANKVKGGVSLKGQGGEKEVATGDLSLMKNLGEAESFITREKEQNIKMSNPALYNQIQVAKRTMKMPNELANMMGGMTKEEAREILRKNNIIQLQEMVAGKKSKAFKIGEYAVGGIIQVNIENTNVSGGEVAISALDWNTKRPVQGSRFVATNFNAIEDYLNELTSSYYAGKVMEWIKANVGDNGQSGFGW